MIKPASFETSLTEAERAAFAFLAGITGTTENRDAFLGRNPGVLNAWHLYPDAMDDTHTPALLATDAATICFPYLADAAFLSREACQRWMMRLIGGLPLDSQESSNVAVLRISKLGRIAHEAVQVANEKTPVIAWSTTVSLDLVFQTGGKSNRSTV